MKPHADYRESGVPFLGPIPAHWTTPPAIALAAVSTSTVDKKSHDGEVPVRLCNYTDVYYRETIEDGPGFMEATASIEQTRLFSVRAGDVVITKDSETSDDIGIPAFVPRDIPGMVYGYHLSVYRPRDRRYSKFLKWVFDSAYVKATFESRTPGVTRVGLSQNTLRYFRIPTPKPDEAVQIASFLDREAAEIDAFIADQEALIGLLAERRSAMISYRVSSGVDPARCMKDTGIKWLGRVPAHWDVMTIKKAATRITDGAHISPDQEGGVFPFVSTRDVGSDGSIDVNGALRTSPSTYDYMVRTGCRPSEGDVLFRKDGTVGRTAVVPAGTIFVVASSLIIITPRRSRVSPKYLDYVLNGRPIQEQVAAFVKGAGLPRLSVANLQRVVTALPPLGEQLRIVASLNEEVGEIDRAIADAREAIALSRERRAALISAAVTGKIDVREHRRVA